MKRSAEGTESYDCMGLCSSECRLSPKDVWIRTKPELGMLQFVNRDFHRFVSCG